MPDTTTDKKVLMHSRVAALILFTHLEVAMIIPTAVSCDLLARSDRRVPTAAQGTSDSRYSQVYPRRGFHAPCRCPPLLRCWKLLRLLRCHLNHQLSCQHELLSWQHAVVSRLQCLPGHSHSVMPETPAGWLKDARELIWD